MAMRLVTSKLAARLVRRSREAAPWLRTLPIAHRGLHGPGVPENSLAALEAAAAAGYAIELDVRGSSDYEAVVFHDRELDRMTPEGGPVAARTAAELGRIRLADGDETIPRLAEALELVAGRVPVLLEIKSSGRPGWLEETVVRRLRTAVGEVAVQSFNPYTVEWFGYVAPAVQRGLLSGGLADADLPAHRRFLLRRLAWVPVCRPDFIGYDLQSLPYWATDATRSAGLPLLAWTVRTPEDLERGQQLADNVIFEHVRPPVPNRGL
jgi:glycerophosphoryl diester phosphodiesterase